MAFKHTCLSRLPLAGFPKETPKPADTMLLMECLETSLTSFNHIKLWTSTIIVTIGGGSFYEVGGLDIDDRLDSCLAKTTVATHYK